MRRSGPTNPRALQPLGTPGRARRRPDLTLPLPPRDLGVMSPTKLRMKVLGSHGHGAGKKDEASGKSSRASPSRLDDVDDEDHPMNSFLAQELDEVLFL
jgi:hypothetical protein